MESLSCTLLACLFAASSAAVALPPTGGQYDSQLGGAYTPPKGTSIVSRDRSAEPAPGLYNICYVNAFQTQPNENDFWLDKHPDLILRDKAGKPVEDANWPGEYLLDTSAAAKRTALANIVGPWISQCGKDGFQAIEADNLDSYSRSQDLLSVEDNMAFATILVGIAHGQGLAFGQKNGVDLLDRPDLPPFDFAITESCQVYDECDAYAARYGAQVFEIEYTDTDPKVFKAACAAHGGQFPIILRDRNLQSPSETGYTYKSC